MNNIVFAIILFLSFISILLILIPFLKRQLREEIKSSQDQFLQLAKQQFESEQHKATTELETRKQAVESVVAGLKDQLIQYQQLIREFEKDRDQKYGSLETELKNASQTTQRLQESTNQLNNILGNVKLRGQWGERIAEDIIQYAGLIKGVNYSRQEKMEDSQTRPDYTFFLPKNNKVNMDVKFPGNNYLKMVNATEPIERARFGDDFAKDVKGRIKEIQSREYINPAENTLDFVLLFIPNEQIFGYIQENMPGLMDEALKQKVVLCSPFTLYAMLSVIRQAHEHFRFEKDLNKIIQHIDLFAKHYDKFKSRFEEIGKFISNLEGKYNEVKNTDFKKLDTKIRHIDEYKKGHKLTITESSEFIELLPETVEDETALP